MTARLALDEQDLPASESTRRGRVREPSEPVVGCGCQQADSPKKSQRVRAGHDPVMRQPPVEGPRGGRGLPTGGREGKVSRGANVPLDIVSVVVDGAGGLQVALDVVLVLGAGSLEVALDVVLVLGAGGLEVALDVVVVVGGARGLQVAGNVLVFAAGA